MKLFVGLGNPGAEYARHRHNVGFMAVERIAEHHGLGPWKKRFHGLSSDGVIAGRKVALLKPQTFMNDSGRSVGEAMRYLKIAPEDVIVFHDELDLAPTKIKVKTGGGNAGHNGLRSISAHIGNEYARVRIGIGHPGAKELVHGYVLHDFAKADAAWLEPLLGAVAEASGKLAAGDAARFLTDVSRSQRDNDEPPQAAPRPVATKKEPALAATAGHPAGERQSKRAGALADNLKRWLTGRRKES
jgi:peptidyl-tRNA hydrolase, PTH1 family